MNVLLELSPVLVFYAVFKLFGIYAATASLMLMTVALMLAHRARFGRFKTMHVVTAGIALVLGTVTLLLHNPRFIQWKPTVLLSITSLAFLASTVLGREPLVRKLFEGVFTERIDLPARTWLFMNTAWAIWFAVLAAANIYIAETFSEGAWVNFKLFGITGALMLFMIPQVIWLSSKASPSQLEGN